VSHAPPDPQDAPEPAQDHRDPEPAASASSPTAPKAFDELFRLHVDGVWRMAVAMGVDPDSAHDVVQNVFVIAHQRRDRFAAGRSVRAWLLGIARNVILHHHRGERRREHRLRLLPEPPPVEPPARALERREAADLVQEFIDQLDDKKKSVFVLGFVEGLTPKEIGGILGLKLPTVYARARAAEAAFARFAERRLRAERRGA
jgi:RNA polymerase sigma-70 factor (ECF subfamily)